MKRAVFLDRDGTLNIEKHYLCDPGQLELFPDALPALKQIATAGFSLFIITNQSGIGRGFYTEADMHAVNEKLLSIARREGVTFQQVYYAPEAPDAPSLGRKPSPQFLLDAQRDHGIDLGRSFMVGDKLTDLECGWNAGVQKSILVKTGYGKALLDNPNADLRRAHVAASLQDAAAYILAH